MRLERLIERWLNERSHRWNLVISNCDCVYFTIWPAIKNNMNANSACAKAICPSENRSSDGRTVECYVLDKNGNRSDTFTCVWKG